MRRVLAVAALSAIVIALASSAGASRDATGVLWRGDYESGDFSQWQRLQALPGRATIVRSPVRQGMFAARYVVRPGDDPIHSSGERAEARASQTETGGNEGTEVWYRWFTLFPTNFDPSPATAWNVFTQWHETLSDGCHPNVSLRAAMDKTPAMIMLRVRGGKLSSGCDPQYDRSWYPARLVLDSWYEFVFHVRWSADPSHGFVELWINGRRVVPWTATATLYRGQGVHLKEGFYRAPSPETSTIYHDGMARADSCRALFSSSETAAPCRTAG